MIRRIWAVFGQRMLEDRGDVLRRRRGFGVVFAGEGEAGQRSARDGRILGRVPVMNLTSAQDFCELVGENIVKNVGGLSELSSAIGVPSAENPQTTCVGLRNLYTGSSGFRGKMAGRRDSARLRERRAAYTIRPHVDLRFLKECFDRQI
jgi:hypothetical protein